VKGIRQESSFRRAVSESGSVGLPILRIGFYRVYIHLAYSIDSDSTPGEEKEGSLPLLSLRFEWGLGAKILLGPLAWPTA
jgi:hypothetical protein